MNASNRKASKRTTRRTLLTDPMGIFLLLISTAMMMAAALFKAHSLPFQRPPDGASRR